MHLHPQYVTRGARAFPLALIAGCASAGTGRTARYHFDFTLGPVPGQYQVWTCGATATDPETGEQLTAPDARARLGEETKTAGDEVPPFPHLEIVLASEPSGRTVTCRATVYAGAQLLGSDRTVVRK